MSRVHLVVHPQKRPLKGSVPVPTDTRIAEVMLLVAALSNGACSIRGFAATPELTPLMRALRAFGVRYAHDEGSALSVQGVGLKGLKAPAEPIDCGDSWATVALLLGVCSGQPFTTWLTGGTALSRTPLTELVRPLRERGAVIIGESHAGAAQEVFLPFEVGPLPASERLRPVEYHLQKPDPWSKDALLLSGLFASGPTLVHEPLVSRDHLERLLSGLGMPLETVGTMLSFHPPLDPQAIAAFDLELVGDISLAAYLLALGAVVEGSAVDTRRTGLNPTRAGILEVFRAFGSRVGITPKGDSVGEPFGEVAVRGSALRGTRIAGELALRALDDFPVSCLLAARAAGQSAFSDLAGLRERDPTLLETVVRLLKAFGVSAELTAEELLIEGRALEPLRAATVDSGGDPRGAMFATVLGLLADDLSVIDNVECLSTSFPRFVGTLRALGAQIEVTQ